LEGHYLPFSIFGPVSRSSSEPNKVSIFPTLAILLSIQDQVKCDSTVLDRELPGRPLRINKKDKKGRKKEGREEISACGQVQGQVSNRWFADGLAWS